MGLKDSIVTRLMLTSKLKKLNKIPNVNAGGCAIVAYGLVEYIKKHHPDKTAKVIYLSNESKVDDLKNNQIGTCAHAVAQIGSKYYDSTGSYTLKGIKAEDNFWHIHHIALDQNIVLESLQHPHWNRLFDRDRDVAVIDGILGTDIQDRLKEK